MYFLSKLAQAAGLTIILIGFIKDFPHLMSYQILTAGILSFVFGWVIQQFMLKK